ncbi:hypothetical protein ACQUJS_14455 [Ralstonia pseudosolanacearum]|uniref:Conserved hypothethical protein n=1 Tax=Ralstonia solanacearum TaxID=305 RepID=A0A0S4TQK6_RALSL|nr:Conserved hypothethical protein [Ralstonia solanacearum]
MEKPTVLEVAVASLDWDASVQLLQSLREQLQGVDPMVGVDWPPVPREQAPDNPVGFILYLEPALAQRLAQGIYSWLAAHENTTVILRNEGQAVELTEGLGFPAVYRDIQLMLPGEPGQTPTSCPLPPDLDGD